MINKILWDLIERVRRSSNTPVEKAAFYIDCTIDEYIDSVNGKSCYLTVGRLNKIKKYVGKSLFDRLLISVCNGSDIAPNYRCLSERECEFLDYFRKMPDDLDRKLFLELVKVYHDKENA